MRYLFAVIMVTLLLPAFAFAKGGHDSLSCVGCHGIHTAEGDIIFAVKPNTQAINPRTKKANTGVTALCLGCHEDTGGMGIIPIKGKSSHPYGIKPNPKIAGVPSKVLRGGKLECVGCHDPHPSNPNYKYLRVPTKGGSQMQEFCSLCHASKSGKKVSDANLFNSMDESSVHKAAPAPKATSKKKKK